MSIHMNMFDFSWFMSGAVVIIALLLGLLVISGFMAQAGHITIDKHDSPFFVEVQPIQP